MPDDDTLLTRRQAADLFRIATRTLDRWRARGLVRAVTVGRVVRFRRADLRALAEHARVPAAATP
jgi:excisionase family DNA binding protein